jgi:uridine kinase
MDIPERPKGESKYRPPSNEQIKGVYEGYNELKDNFEERRKRERVRVFNNLARARDGIVKLIVEKIGEAEEKEPMVVGIGGPGASGKTTLARLIKAELYRNGVRSSILQLDEYFKPLSDDEINKMPFRFDNPGNSDLLLAVEHIKKLANGKEVPRLKFVYGGRQEGVQHKREERGVIKPADVILVEGLFPQLLEGIDMMHIGLLAHPETILDRRYRRDTKPPWSKTKAHIFDGHFQVYMPGALEHVIPKVLEKCNIVVFNDKEIDFRKS